MTTRSIIELDQPFIRARKRHHTASHCCGCNRGLDGLRDRMCQLPDGKLSCERCALTRQVSNGVA
jgi:hypothetical protein